MARETQIPIADRDASGRFATRLALFYGALFGLSGTYMPFFSVWLKAVGIDASWIGIITSVPSVTRFTIQPLLAGLAERRRSLHGAMIATACLTAFGFAAIGTQDLPLAVFLIFAATACVWTATLPMTDAYALKGVARYGLDYGPLRLWGSAAFVVGAVACGFLADLVAARHLIWVIAAMAALGAAASFGLQPLNNPRRTQSALPRARALLRDPGFVAVIVAAGLIQGSHAAYYTFASITWQASGFDGLTISGLWVSGVLAEIVVFALSPRFTWQPGLLMTIGGLAAVARWLITAQEPAMPVLGIAQLAHSLSFGLTQVGTMGLLVRLVPGHAMASAQGYLAACTGFATSTAAILCGAVYDRIGQGVYDVMAVMALSGAIVVWLARKRLAHHPHSAASGG